MTTEKLKILLCCHLPLRATLGGAKVYIEAAETYKMLGHNVTLIGIDDIVGNDAPFMDESWRVENFPSRLLEYINSHGHLYDVIEYESIYLPFKINDDLKCILVARSVLLDLHLREIKIPRFKGVKSLLGLLFKSSSRKKKLNLKIEQSLQTIRLAHFVNVPNPDDKAILIKYGIPANKIIVQPYGIFENKFKEFEKARSVEHQKPIIAFVGTFDNRKGAVEFPVIIKSLLQSNADLEFKLLGVCGMFPSEETIYQYLGSEFRDRIQIYGKYKPENLPELLSDCSIGIFPSYLESFGFGVLEMMARGLVVVGYNSPGTNMLLLEELMVARGDVKGLIDRLNKLIHDKTFNQNCLEKYHQKVQNFIYEYQQNSSITNYQQKLKEIKG